MSLYSDVTREIKALNQTNRSMRIFGILHGVLLILIGIIVLFHHGWSMKTCPIICGILLGIGVLSLLAASFMPLLLRPIHKVMFILGMSINWVLIRIMLSCAFFLVLTPTGFMLKLIGKDALGLKLKKGSQSYWVDKTPAEFDKNRCKHLF